MYNKVNRVQRSATGREEDETTTPVSLLQTRTAI